MTWTEDIIESLRGVIALEERPIKYEPGIDIIDVCVDQNDVYLGELSSKDLYRTEGRVDYNAQNPYPAPISSSKTLSSIESRVFVHMEFNLSAVPALRYQTGDHLVVWPINPEDEVNRLTRLLGWDETYSKKPILIETKEASASKSNLPSPTTRETLLKYYLGIGGVVSRDFLLLLSQYAPTEGAKESLMRLGKNKEEFRDEVAGRYLSLGRVMEMVEAKVKWTDVPFSLLVESFNRLQPRSYSISSSPLVQPRQPTITLVVNDRQSRAQEDAKEEIRFHGLATNFLLAHDRSYSLREQTSLQTQQQQVLAKRPLYDLEGPRKKLAGGKVYMYIKRSTFKLPTNPATPIIMVGAGTGIAPFRGFLQERARLAELGRPIGKMVLLFGCRDDSSDFLYKEEWEEYKARLGDRFVLIPAFSRLAGHKKNYVQDIMIENKELIAPMVEEGAALYICGAAAMAREVRSRLTDVLADRSGQRKEDIDERVIRKMKKAGLYHEDVWG